MNLLGLMGLCVWLLVLGALAVGLVVLIVACCLRKWKVVKWTITITLATVIVLVVGSGTLMYFLWRPWDASSEAELKEAYRADFGVLPPTGITVLHARSVVVGDDAVQWFLLKASPEEIEKQIANGFTPAQGAPRDFDGHIGPNAPRWWKPQISRLRLYESSKWPPAAGAPGGHAAMGVDTSTGLIWFWAEQL